MIKISFKGRVMKFLFIAIILYLHDNWIHSHVEHYNNSTLDSIPWQFNGSAWGRPENDRDWMGHYIEGNVTDPVSLHTILRIFRQPPSRIIPIPHVSFEPNTDQVFGTGVLDFAVLYDAIFKLPKISGSISSKGIHLGVIDLDRLSASTARHFQYVWDYGSSEVIDSHAEKVAKIIVARNTIASDPDRSHDIVGAIPRSLQISSRLILSAALSQKTHEDPYATHPASGSSTWRLPIKRADNPELKATAVLTHPFAVARLLEKEQIRLEHQKGFCGYNQQCLFQNNSRHPDIYTWTLDSDAPAADVINISMGTMLNRAHISGFRDPDRFCGGTIFEALIDDLPGIHVIAGANNDKGGGMFEDQINSYLWNCPNVIGVYGYHRYSASRNQAILAAESPFYEFQTTTPGLKVLQPFETPAISMAFGRTMPSIRAPGGFDIFNFYGGNSYSAPLVAGLITAMGALRADFLGPNAHATLLMGSNKNAFVPRVASESLTSGKHLGNHSVPIVNPTCMLVQSLLSKRVLVINDFIEAVGSEAQWQALIARNGCTISTAMTASVK
jgi:hypothetical protein